MRYFLLMCCLSIASVAAAQDAIYPVDSIPESLKKNANVVKRLEEVYFEVKDIDKAVYKAHRVYTILNEEGASELTFSEYTNKNISLEDVEIRSFSGSGQLLMKFRKKDLLKHASMGQFVDDGYVYYLEVPASSYPITVEFNYEIVYTGTLTYPSYLVCAPGESVESSTYTARVPAELGLRYKEQKLSLPPSTRSEGKSLVYQWQVKNREAVKFEPGAASPRFNNPAILLAPNKFKHFNSWGDLSSWKSFGEWAYQLLKGIDELPTERIIFFNSLVKNAKTDREKAAILYQYLQANFRYVSIQVGIGGVKPFPVKFTDEKKYGDCKGLSFYMYAALKSVGIKSHVAFINAQYNQVAVDPSFPCDRFNHAILCIPQPSDTIWLECTSNTAEFGVLGTFTENRNALLITESGGKLVATPASRAAANRAVINTSINLQDDGSGVTETAVTATGEFREYMNALCEAKKDDQKKILVERLGFKQPDEFAVEKTGIEKTGTRINLSIEKIPQFRAGSKMFLSARMHAFIGEKMPTADNRSTDYYFRFPYEICDTTAYLLPEGYIVEALPKSRELNSHYASYSSKYWYDSESNKVFSVADFVLTSHIIPAGKYSQVKKFFDELAGTEGQKIVIKRN